MTVRLVSSQATTVPYVVDAHALGHQAYCMAWYRMMGLRTVSDCRCHDDVTRVLLLSAIAQFIRRGERDPSDIARRALNHRAICRND